MTEHRRQAGRVRQHRAGPEARRQPHRGDALADIDQHRAQRELPPLRAQCIRAAGIAAAVLADVDAAQPPEQQAARERTEQVRGEEDEQGGEAGAHGVILGCGT
jgi:hypothetical protein